MSEHNIIGHLGEDVAAELLEKEGYTILYRNWRHKALRVEVDIIAVDQNCLVFVEVKTRTGYGFGLPVEAVTLKKQKNIIKAAHAFVYDRVYYGYSYIRFDVVSIILDKKSHELKSYELLKDAFRPAPRYYN